MAEELILTKTSKEEKYQELLPQIYSLVSYETNVVANMANVTAVLKQAFDFFWVGFYVADGEQLVLAPFQGPLACTRIKKGKGVCGTVFQNGITLVVEDVDAFPGHIACSSASKSEVVVPLIKNGEVVAVLDIDSDKLSDFDEIDSKYLTEMCEMLAEIMF